jgi:predicted peptidase
MIGSGMKFFAGLLLCAVLLGAGAGLGRAEESLYLEQKLGATSSAPESANRRYRLMTPLGWKAEEDGRHPLVIYMHGAGSKGSDGVKPLREELPRLLATPEMRGRFRCFVLVPQCRDGDDVSGERPNNWVKWDNQRLKPSFWLKSDDDPSDQLLGAMAALEDVLARYPVDVSRIYLTGVSMGGSASWNWASRDPGRFAAMVPVCGLSDGRRARWMATVPVWTFHGDQDEQVPVQRTRDMVELLKRAGSGVRYTEYAGDGHGIAKRVWSEDDHATLRWLFEQRKVDK